jgi:hypothetical protein
MSSHPFSSSVSQHCRPSVSANSQLHAHFIRKLAEFSLEILSCALLNFPTCSASAEVHSDLLLGSKAKRSTSKRVLIGALVCGGVLVALAIGLGIGMRAWHTDQKVHKHVYLLPDCEIAVL